jgi:3-carboxy-cis,cis-muconate cycloisomerase
LNTADAAFDRGLLSPATVGSDGAVSDVSLLRALVQVEGAYLAALVKAGIAPSGVGPVSSIELPDLDGLARAARETGNPLVPLLAHLRSRVDAETATWLHRGATSQDILDSALMLTALRARATILTQLGATIAGLAELAEQHRHTVAAARTLTQHSTPTTWGLRFATWLGGVLDARDALAAVVLPPQLGGASGTLAALVELSDSTTAAAVRSDFAAQLQLAEAAPWHTSRAPITRLGDALTEVTDALGMIATNVATLARTEIAELREPSGEGRGGSSTMPQKQNPVLSVLIRSLSVRAPGLNSTLHLCAANAVDERPDGAWHAEWPTLRELLRIAMGASTLAAELTAGLTVDLDNVATNLALDDIMAEQRSMSGRSGGPEGYLGLSDQLVDAALERARS